MGDYVEKASAEHPKVEDLKFASFTDGVQVWYFDRVGNGGSSCVWLERHLPDRRKWAVVDRRDYEGDGTDPPILYGPFDNFRAAVAAYILVEHQYD